jgi:hypothetical protein
MRGVFVALISLAASKAARAMPSGTAAIVRPSTICGGSA